MRQPIFDTETSY